MSDISAGTYKDECKNYLLCNNEFTCVSNNEYTKPFLDKYIKPIISTSYAVFLYAATCNTQAISINSGLHSNLNSFMKPGLIEASSRRRSNRVYKNDVESKISGKELGNLNKAIELVEKSSSLINPIYVKYEEEYDCISIDAKINSNDRTVIAKIANNIFENTRNFNSTRNEKIYIFGIC